MTMLARPADAKDTDVSPNKVGFGARLRIPLLTQLSPLFQLYSTNVGQGLIQPSGTFEFRHWNHPGYFWGFHFGFNALTGNNQNGYAITWGFSVVGARDLSPSARFLYGARTSLVYSFSPLLPIPLPFPLSIQLEPLIGVAVFPFSHRRVSISLTCSAPIVYTFPESIGLSSVSLNTAILYYFD